MRQEPGAEVTRRMFNVWEALIVAGLCALAGLLFSTRDAVIKLQATQEATNATLDQLHQQLANLAQLSDRMTRTEARVDQLESDVKDLKDHRR